MCNSCSISTSTDECSSSMWCIISRTKPAASNTDAKWHLVDPESVAMASWFIQLTHIHRLPGLGSCNNVFFMLTSCSFTLNSHLNSALTSWIVSMFLFPSFCLSFVSDLKAWRWSRLDSQCLNSHETVQSLTFMISNVVVLLNISVFSTVAWFKVNH